MIKKLARDFEMLFNFKAICSKLTNFSYLENVELRVLAKEMTSLDMPFGDQWKIVENYGKSKYKFRQ